MKRSSFQECAKARKVPHRAANGQAEQHGIGFGASLRVKRKQGRGFPAALSFHACASRGDMARNSGLGVSLKVARQTDRRYC